MRRVLSGISGVLLVLLAVDARIVAQPAASTTEFVAFRVDDRHVIAVVGEAGNGGPDDTSAPGEPAAQYGFRPRDAGADAMAKIPEPVKSATRWVVHLPGGRRVTASAERVVQGAPSCTSLVGVLLTIDEGGRGEVISAGGGYESSGVDVRALTPTGFVPMMISYAYGC